MSRRRVLKLEPPQPERLGCFFFPPPAYAGIHPTFLLLGFRANALNSHFPSPSFESGRGGGEGGELGTGGGGGGGGEGQGGARDRRGASGGPRSGQGRRLQKPGFLVWWVFEQSPRLTCLAALWSLNTLRQGPGTRGLRRRRAEATFGTGTIKKN